MKLPYTLFGFLLLLCTRHVASFAGSSSSSGDEHTPPRPVTLFDRFRAVCPADSACIRQYDESLDTENGVWVAIYRSNNNKPTVLIRDEFLHAMRSATEYHAGRGSNHARLAMQPPTNDLDNKFETTMPADNDLAAPVAVARLVPAEKCYILDSMRCMLKKEDLNAECDGGSEHAEAIGTAIDVLLELYVSSTSSNRFENAIRTKATLVSGALLEERGFSPVDRLDKDMTTHVSSLDACLERYAARSVSATNNPGAQQRALSIVSLLGRLNRQDDLKAAAQEQAESGSDDEDEYDPWAGVDRL